MQGSVAERTLNGKEEAEKCADLTWLDIEVSEQSFSFIFMRFSWSIKLHIGVDGALHERYCRFW